MAFSGAWMFSSFGSFSASLAAALLSQAPAAPDGGAAAPAQAPSIIDSLGMLPILVVITALFYFMLIRPQRREQATRQSMLDQLKKNDRVVTSGGLYGVVVNVHQGADEVTLRVDETSNTRVKVTRSSIVRVLGDEAVESTESKETK
ncbi:MAG: preprotein translocase subunit YajC [Planctomycetia bacterium]|nr:preprotein translocase subunit YajC [Planctomycetia bacterium]